MSNAAARTGAGSAPRRSALVALVFPIALAVAACAGSGTSSGAPSSAASATNAVSPSGSADVAGATGSPSASAASSPTADDACSLVTTDEAAQLIGATSVTATPAATPAGPTCRYTPAETGAQGFLTISVFQSDVEQTVTDAIENFGLGEVPGVGSTAAGADGTIYVSTGSTAFAIVAADGTFQPIPLTDLTTLASTIVERLGGTNAAPSASPSASDAGASASPSPSAS